MPYASGTRACNLIIESTVYLFSLEYSMCRETVMTHSEREGHGALPWTPTGPLIWCPGHVICSAPLLRVTLLEGGAGNVLDTGDTKVLNKKPALQPPEGANLLGTKVSHDR